MKRFVGLFASFILSVCCLESYAVDVKVSEEYKKDPLDDKPKNSRSIDITGGDVKSEDGYVWGSESEKDKWSGRLHYEYGPEGKISIGKTDDGYGIGVEGKWHNIDSFIISTPEYGNEYLNVKNEFEVGIKEEVGVEFDLMRIQKKGDEVELNVLKAEVGAAITAFAKSTTQANILFIPVTVEAEGGVSAGAKAGAEAGLNYNMETGELTLSLGASVVWGWGLEGDVQISIGILQGINNLIMRISSDDSDQDSDSNQKGDSGNGQKSKTEDKPDNGDDPFDEEPEGPGVDSGKAGRYQGLKPLRLID